MANSATGEAQKIPCTLSTGDIVTWIWCNVYFTVTLSSKENHYDVSVQISEQSSEYMEWDGTTSIQITCNGVTQTKSLYASLYGKGQTSQKSEKVTFTNIPAPSSGTSKLNFDILVDLRSITGSNGLPGPWYDGRAGVNFWYFEGTASVDISSLSKAPVLNSIEITSATVNSITVKPSIGDWGIPTAGVYYSLDNKNFTNISLSNGTFTITGLSAYTNYTVYVRLSNSSGNSTTRNASIRTAGITPNLNSISNNNPYSNNAGISADPNSISIKFDVSNWGTPAGTLYWSCTGGKSGTATSGSTFNITGLSPGSTYTVTVYIENAIFSSKDQAKTITIRTRGAVPSVSLSLSSRTLTTLVFNWSSTVQLSSTQYKLDSGQWTNLGQTGTSGTITITASINSSHTVYFKGVGSTDSLASNEVSASGTTYDIARITVANDQIFGTGTFKVTVTNPSGSSATLTMWITGNNLTRTFTKNLTAAGDYEFNLTQDDWDNIYKCFSNTQNINTLPLYYQISTASGSSKWNDDRKDKTLTLTGIAKTAHIKPSGQTAVKRCQCWIKVNGVNRRAVAWINAKGQGIKRCI